MQTNHKIYVQTLVLWTFFNAYIIMRSIWHTVGGLKWESQLYFGHLHPFCFVQQSVEGNWDLSQSVYQRHRDKFQRRTFICTQRLKKFCRWCFFMSAAFFFFLKSRLKGSKDEMLLDMINKQPTSVNVCSYTHWMTGCNWLQPVWCNKAHYYANPASPCDSNVVCWEWVREGGRAGRKRHNQESVRPSEREREKANEWLCVSVFAVCLCARLSVPLRSL